MNDDFESFQVDSTGEFAFLLNSKSELIKVKLDESAKSIWKVNGVLQFCLCNSKSEIYTVSKYDNKNVTVRIWEDSNGILKRELVIKDCKKLSDFDLINMKRDDKKRLLFLFRNDLRTRLNSKIVLYDEIRNQSIKMKMTEISMVDFTKEGYLLFYSGVDLAYIYDDKSGLVLLEMLLPCSFNSVSYFETISNTLCRFGICPVEKDRIEILSNVVNMPLKEETCQSLQRLGCQLPISIQVDFEWLGFFIPDYLQMLLTTNYGNMQFWYQDDELAARFKFITTPHSLNFEDHVVISDSDDNLTVSVKKSDLSIHNNFSGDFPIYLSFIDSKKGISIKSFTLSEFIPKLLIVECGKKVLSFTICFAKIFEELLEIGIIDSKRNINPTTLLERYQEIICSSMQENMNINLLGEYFGHSTIRLDERIYKKMDLIVLAKYCPKYLKLFGQIIF
ncbi:predicted protein [Naegleria gruberi]|uniref:Predicted protein n=1 Tax=Naegleria gruberi TaxID=5762 RepID=D2VYH6_NAEGR|nr:uncharacterized protein NAEGRDRAFT_74124 [Naegleria gruberi]EFC38061.1 predicted protein [Naegleria gruberi]|eukprot:XP_002670805.1 predicted protein [Naegleria gruberi strain NEG-M]